jgi:hypothetical protein
MTALLPIILKMFGRLFCFAHISTGENDKILNLFLKDLSSEALQKPHEPILLVNEKSLSNAFNMMGSNTVM